MTMMEFCTRPFHRNKKESQNSCSQNDSDVLQRIYTIEYTKQRQKDRLVHKCRHCLHCQGIPSNGNTYQKIRDKVSNAMMSNRVEQQRQKQDMLSLSQEEYLSVRIRTNPIPETRWRSEESLGSDESVILSKRKMNQIGSLKLPERCTNITNARIDVPSDAYMEKYSFSMRLVRDQDGKHPVQDIVARSEVPCKNGKYLETTQRQFKSKATKTSPQTVLADFPLHLRSSSSDSASSASNHEDSMHSSAESFDYSNFKVKKGKRQSNGKKGKLSTLEKLNMFLQSCMMSPEALYETVNEI